MLEHKVRSPRAPEDRRMNLYYDTFRGRLRWYVKVSKTGRRIDITEEYSTDEQSDFHKAWEAAVRAFGGVPRMRRTKPDDVPATSRRYLISDVSDKGQLRWYVQLRDKLPKIRIQEAFGSDEFKSGGRCSDCRPDRKVRRRHRLDPRRKAEARKACAAAHDAARSGQPALVLDALQAERPLARQFCYR